MDRVDGRKPFEYREIKLELGISKKAEGSAKVTIGNTQVVAGVKLEVGEPYPDIHDQGILIVNAELLPLASPEFEAGRPGEDAIEIARVVDRGIRESEAIDLEKLCIEPGEKVWIVWIDLYVLDHDGNLIDASALAAIYALLNTKMLKYDGELIMETAGQLPVVHKPVACTFRKLEGELILDPSLEEEKEVGCRLTITTDELGRVCAMQKGEIGTFNRDEVLKLIKIAKEKGDELRKLI